MMNTAEVFKLLRRYRWFAEGFIRRKTMGTSYYYCDATVYRSLTLAQEESHSFSGEMICGSSYSHVSLS
ncbi:hypothetical protein [Candidatus Borrarchaeum sp.]|uniref:hypothetical protein n=1 Tax=Candidatus Borrarchaeum sp. TaxID=2846742 RepID=UPI00257BAF94|nr:hypothetical protein [Candidatus Borrarchaeum sp.]